MKRYQYQYVCTQKMRKEEETELQESWDLALLSLKTIFTKSLSGYNHEEENNKDDEMGKKQK